MRNQGREAFYSACGVFGGRCWVPREGTASTGRVRSTSTVSSVSEKSASSCSAVRRRERAHPRAPTQDDALVAHSLIYVPAIFPVEKNNIS